MAPVETPARKPKQAFVPTYRRIESSLREQIENGIWAAGTMLPGRRELAKQYGVDLNTIQSAIRILVEDGTLRAEGRRGTFVPLPSPSGGHQLRRIPAAPVVRRNAVQQNLVGVVAAVHSEYLSAPSPDGWQMMVVHALEQELGKDDGVTVSFQNRWAPPLKDSASATIDGVRNLVAEGADAIIVVTPRQSEIDALLAIADSSRVPVVLVTPDYTAKRMVPQIRYDNANAGYLAADHLIQRGYDQITFFAPYTAWWGDERLQGVQDAIYRNGLKAEQLDAEDYDKAIYAEMNNQEDVAYREAVRLLDSARNRHGHPGWGVVAINDHAAYGFLRAASERNIVPGVDYGIIAFDDLMMSRTFGLTTLRAPYDQMGAEAGRMVRQVLSGGNMPMELSLQSSVVARKSTLPQTR